MHAILGLAASDLMSQDPSLVTFAMTHRLKAIKAIKKTLTDVPKTNTFEEGNALMATCFALTFQSVLLDDGMAEFMTFCRGIVIVAIQMYCKGAKFVFHDFIGDDQVALLQPHMEKLPPIQRDWTDMAVAAIRNLEPLCQHQVETEYYALLLEMAEASYTSAFQGRHGHRHGHRHNLLLQVVEMSPANDRFTAYQALCKHYGWWMQIPHENFQHLINPANDVCTLLASHWIALKQIMATITEMEHQCRSAGSRRQESRDDGDPDMGMLRWLKHLNRQLGPDYQQYNQWPLWVEAELDRDITTFGKGLPLDRRLG
jgi:hypothetical protein